MIADDLIASCAPYMEKHFFNKIAGASHRNSDGTSRKRIIGECDPGDELELVPEPDNEFDPNAVAVRNQYGKQLGLLQAWTAKEVSRDILKGHRRWICYLAHRNLHPETDKVVGATLLLFCLSEESASAWFALEEQRRLREATEVQRLKRVEAVQGSRFALADQQIVTPIRTGRRFWKQLKEWMFGKN